MKALIYRLWYWWNGPFTQVETDSMDAWGSRLTTEYKVLNRNGREVGYWAYGSYDPIGKYQGPPK